MSQGGKGHNPLDTALIQAHIARPHDRIANEDVPDRVSRLQVKVGTKHMENKMQFVNYSIQ